MTKPEDLLRDDVIAAVYHHIIGNRQGTTDAEAIDAIQDIIDNWESYFPAGVEAPWRPREGTQMNLLERPR